jgi:hypothetical protein
LEGHAIDGVIISGEEKEDMVITQKMGKKTKEI